MNIIYEFREGLVIKNIVTNQCKAIFFLIGRGIGSVFKSSNEGLDTYKSLKFSLHHINELK